MKSFRRTGFKKLHMGTDDSCICLQRLHRGDVKQGSLKNMN